MTALQTWLASEFERAVSLPERWKVIVAQPRPLESIPADAYVMAVVEREGLMGLLLTDGPERPINDYRVFVSTDEYRGEGRALLDWLDQRVDDARTTHPLEGSDNLARDEFIRKLEEAGEQLRRKRRWRKVTQEAVAGEVGLHRTTLNERLRVYGLDWRKVKRAICEGTQIVP